MRAALASSSSKVLGNTSPFMDTVSFSSPSPSSSPFPFFFFGLFGLFAFSAFRASRCRRRNSSTTSLFSSFSSTGAGAVPLIFRMRGTAAVIGTGSESNPLALVTIAHHARAPVSWKA